MTLNERFITTLAAARTGADWAWTEIYRDLAPVVLAFLRGRRAPEPEDLLGEVFLQVVKSVDRFEGNERDFRTWVLAIAHRRMVDAFRHRARRPVDPAPDDLLGAHGPAADAEAQALDNAELTRALSAIRFLSADQQDVLVMRLVADLSVEEVAAVLGKRPGAVRALQRRGLASLRKELHREGVSL